jgi:hypothetical protein
MEISKQQEKQPPTAQDVHVPKGANYSAHVEPVVLRFTGADVAALVTDLDLGRVT